MKIDGNGSVTITHRLTEGMKEGMTERQNNEKPGGAWEYLMRILKEVGKLK